MKKTVFVMMISVWPLLPGGDGSDELTLRIPSEVRLYSGTSKHNMLALSNAICIDKEVARNFYDLINHNFHPISSIAQPDDLIFTSLSEQEVKHLAEFLNILYESRQEQANEKNIHEKFYKLSKKISRDSFYRKFMTSLHELYGGNHRTIITKELMKELVQRRPSKPWITVPPLALFFAAAMNVLIIVWLYNGNSKFKIEMLIIATVATACLLYKIARKDYFWENYIQSLELDDSYIV